MGSRIRRGLIDITRPLHQGTPVWPGDVPYRTCWTARRIEGAIANVAELRLTSHAGTHVDAPFHALDGGRRVGELPLDAFFGPALVVDVRGRSTIDSDLVDAVTASGGVERVLLATGCWGGLDRFPEMYAALDPDAASRLRDAGVRLIGTDAPSVDPFDSESLPTHRVLADANIPILENLLLDGVAPGPYELIAFPLRLMESDASPVRAVLRPLA